MLESAVVCSRVDEACQAKLPYIPQSLEPRILNEIKNKIARNVYESINRVVDNLSFVRPVSHRKKT